MEDIKAYIESGILELYVLGDVTPEECAQVEAMAQKHPAIKAELDEIERSLQLYAEENAIEPSENLRGRVLNSLVVNLGDDRTFGPGRTAAEEEDDDIIPISRARSNTFFKYAFAACLALLIISIVALISVYNKLQDSNNLVASLQSQNQRFASQANLMDKELTVFRDPSFKMLKLQGTSKSPSSMLMVAWSPAKKKVMIDMVHGNMPANDKDHQYQLWALVGNKPVDLGVFDADSTSKGMKQMKSIASADAFAVTLEPRGGSASPTMDQMMVIGKF
ncbi:anti-sigma factor [Mucilaginibacter sp. BT774]|uniref:anti-sigma factor n=1 Tax=Mucilaginibacter sp. BT774 TaxID=3062276 RepID=UPI002674979A|nr:anti-sigma factor [Mucilaginibacter sp. BT774]MDO3625610.1 anti-sigma factor [Mucilaginibacter sp. BT774]